MNFDRHNSAHHISLLQKGGERGWEAKDWQTGPVTCGQTHRHDPEKDEKS